jgi:hypothetical protein
LDEILYGGDAVAGDVNATAFNPVASTSLKWLRVQSCEVDVIPEPFSLA